MEKGRRLRVGISKQERIYETSKELLNAAGYGFKGVGREAEVLDRERNIAYFDVKGFGTITEYLARDDLDVMFVGSDIVAELVERIDRVIPSILDTQESKARFSPLALPQNGEFDPKVYKEIASKYPNLARKWLNKSRDSGIQFADDLFVKEIESDADKMAQRYRDMLAMDISQTGTTARTLGLDNLADTGSLPDGMKTSLQLFAREDLPSYLQEEAETLKRCLEMVVNARQYGLLQYNIANDKLEQALKLTPDRDQPTIQDQGDFSVVNVLVKKKNSARIMDKLTQLGAKSPITLPINLSASA